MKNGLHYLKIMIRKYKEIVRAHNNAKSIATVENTSDTAATDMPGKSSFEFNSRLKHEMWLLASNDW